MKFKKFLSLLLCGALMAGVGLSACGDTPSDDSGNNNPGGGGDKTDTPVQLTAPSITLSGTEISGSAVDHADGYEVYEGTTKVSSQTTTTYTIIQSTVGKYSYTVYATSTDTEHYSKSVASNAVEYEVKAQEEEKELSEQLGKTATIYVVGDSTVCDYRPKLDDYYLPRYGYGTQLYNYLNLEEGEAQINNLALSGRSSLSFLTEPEYNTLKNSIKEGDYLIIGFGHNDEKSAEAARFTDPNPDYQTPTNAKGSPSFQYTLYENYVKLAKDKGATPILCTPIVRYNATGSYTGSVAHVTSDGDYPAAIKKLGADTGTAVVDLTKITADYYTANNDDAKYFHAFTTYNESGSDKIPDGIDTTHINMYGAKMISYWFASNLPKDCPLAKHILTIKEAPTYEVDFPKAVKADYEKPSYSGFNPAEYASNKVGTIGDGEWYHTAMGVLGGNKAGSYTFTSANGKYTIAADGGSKFAATQDGFGAIFTQIDITKNFTISAKAKVTGKPSSVNDQNAFGIMLRDDIYIDSNIGTITSNFVSASVTGSGKANMSRTSKTALDYDKTIAFAQDVEYEITFERIGQTINVTIAQGSSSVTSKFTDTSFVGIDNNHFYLCLFANRGLTVEFSDIAFAITGEAQGA